MEMILLLVAMFAIMYFLMIRPQQKKMKEDMQMRSQLAEGDRVLLTSGIFGTIAHVGERQMIIELAPGVEITVLKGNVARQVLPADEEFEFTDEVGADEAGDAADAVDAVDAVDAGSDDLTRENFDNMFDPRGDVGATDVVADETSEPTVEPTAEGTTSGYQPWERTEDTPADDDEPRSGDSK